eukprot:6174265-Pleurochrysis_carterae.AAC.2
MIKISVRLAGGCCNYGADSGRWEQLGRAKRMGHQHAFMGESCNSWDGAYCTWMPNAAAHHLLGLRHEIDDFAQRSARDRSGSSSSNAHHQPALASPGVSVNSLSASAAYGPTSSNTVQVHFATARLILFAPSLRSIASVFTCAG